MKNMFGSFVDIWKKGKQFEVDHPGRVVAISVGLLGSIYYGSMFYLYKRQKQMKSN